MRKRIAIVALTAVVCGGSLVWAAGEEFAEMMNEMKNCTVCKAMVEHPEMMQNMTWETHKIDAGMLNLATVDKAHKKEFADLHAQMMKSVETCKADMMAGKDVPLCHYCEGMGELMKAGAKQQHVETATGQICLVTSSDPAVVAKIHAQADQAIAEQKKMAEMMAH